MRIKLLPTPAKQIAQDILSGVLFPETYDLEVIAWLSELDLNLEFYRIEDRGIDSKEVVFWSCQVKIALENQIEMRPIEP
jgi:hypothetical protein